jgi:hypothetical protein
MTSNPHAEMFVRMKVDYFMARRQALLMEVDALEKGLVEAGVRIEPLTAELRRWWKQQKREGA